MAATAEERIPALTTKAENFSLAVPFAAFASEHRIGANAVRDQKTHQGIFSTNRALYVNAMWAKCSETHQVSGQWWAKTVLGIVIDANGNTLSDAQGRSFTWDFENRLTQAVVPGTNGGTTTFKYDPFGRRIQKSGPLGTTNYLYDGANVNEELDNAGNVLARYTQDDATDQPLSMLRAGTTSYYQQDGLGSVSSLSNAAGALVNTYAYDSFGKLTASTGTLTNPFQYTGREFDFETGIYEYRARYYDPSAGRFSSEDPSGFGGGLNFYEYGYNNPTDFIDSFGLQSTQPGCPLYVPCGPSAYGPPTDTTPPPPPTPTVPSWWPGSGPGSGSVPSPTLGPSPTPGPGPTPAPSPSDRANEYNAYKNRCNQPPPPGLSPCDLARWKLQRNRDCRNMRQSWDDNWMPGRHATDIANLDRSVQNLEAWIKQNCACK